jgi:hypothetical protein
MKPARRSAFHAVMVLAVAALLLGGGSTAMAAGSSDLIFSGDSSFNGPHGGQAISVAVVRTDDGAVVAEQSGTVSKTADPSFSFTFPGVLEDGKAYEVHYWIDSNFGGGTVGVCDPKAHDHQWNVPLGTVNGNVTHMEKHRPAETSDVCDTFK